MEYVKHLLYNFLKKNLFFLRPFFFSEIYSLYHSGFNTYTVFAGKQLVAPVFLHKNPQIFKDTLILDMGVRSITTQDCLLIIIYLYKFLFYDL